MPPPVPVDVARVATDRLMLRAQYDEALPPPAVDRDLVDKIRVRAAELILQGWCQDTYAKNEAGQAVCWTDPGAVEWCALGAVMLACDQIADFDSILYESAVLNELQHEPWWPAVGGVSSLPGVNDDPDMNAVTMATLLRGWRG